MATQSITPERQARQAQPSPSPDSPGKEGHSPVAAPSAEQAPAEPPDSILNKTDPNLSNRALLRWMFSFLRPVKFMVVVACFYLAAYATAEVLFVRQTGQTGNYIQRLHQDMVAGAAAGGLTQQTFWPWFTGASPQAVELRRIILILGGLALLMGVMRYCKDVSGSKLSMAMVYYLRQAVYDKLQRVGFGFHDAISTGQLINRSLTDLQHVRTFVQSSVLITLEMVLIVGGYIILILSIYPWLAALALVPLPIWTWYILRFSKVVQPSLKAVMEAEDKNVSIITENIAGVHVVKAFATEQQEIGKYNTNADDFFTRVMKRIRLFANFTPIIRGIALSSHLSLFLLGGILMVYHRLQVGDFIILGSAMGAILARLQQVQVINEQYQSAIVSARRLHEVLMAPPTVQENPKGKPMPPGGGAVTFENVTFGYSPAQPVVKNVSFQVPAGTSVAIVGPTGAGKSTLVNLLSRFYDPQQGRILIDGVDIRDVTLNSLRTQVGYVFQETYLFSDTVEANIAYGRQYLRAGEVEAASRLAQAHEFIEELPKGYGTILGERGASLSGGQRQRLAIARAILTNPRILVLDDATAAVDSETEDQIRKAMDAVMRDRTTFWIAHRISTVKQADVVLVLEEGRITQMGTHDELMNQEGHYRQIAAAQLYGEAGDEPSHMDRVREEQRLADAAAQRREARASEEMLSP